LGRQIGADIGGYCVDIKGEKPTVLPSTMHPPAHRGSKRDAQMQTIKDNPSGLTRGEIMDRMGLKGDKSGEMSVSNALTALTKSNQVRRDGGKYHAAS